MASTYTTRFIRGPVAGTYTWTCPSGYRAVVRNAQVVAGMSTGTSASLAVAGVQVWNTSFPEPVRPSLLETRAVCFAGEAVVLVLSGSVILGCVSGYLFADDGSGLELQGRATFDPFRREPLPST